MHETEFFPLETLPSWVRIAVLREFNGRRPTVREVERICDRSWLAVPGIGRTALANIRQATGDQQPLGASASVAGMSDSELLTRLEALQEELKNLSGILSATLVPVSKKGVRSGRMRRISSNAHELQGSGMAF
jgi:hypothetical protein